MRSGSGPMGAAVTSSLMGQVVPRTVRPHRQPVRSALPERVPPNACAVAQRSDYTPNCPLYEAQILLPALPPNLTRQAGMVDRAMAMSLRYHIPSK